MSIIKLIIEENVWLFAILTLMEKRKYNFDRSADTGSITMDHGRGVVLSTSHAGRKMVLETNFVKSMGNSGVLNSTIQSVLIENFCTYQNISNDLNL